MPLNTSYLFRSQSTAVALRQALFKEACVKEVKSLLDIPFAGDSS